MKSMKTTGDTMSGKKYLGSVWETLQGVDGRVRLTKMYAYLVSGERRYALTEEAALAAVAS